jgi:flagellar FlgN protein
MSKHLSDLQTILGQLVVEQTRLLALMETQYTAMKKLDVKGLLEVAHQQETVRLRIIDLENRRQGVCRQLAAAAKLSGDLTVSRIIELFPPHAEAFKKLRTQLRDLIGKVSQRASMASKLSGAVVGHLNTALRILAAAVERAGVYTKNGVPRVATRLGVMDAVG